MTGNREPGGGKPAGTPADPRRPQFRLPTPLMNLPLEGGGSRDGAGRKALGGWIIEGGGESKTP
jgi:hypothetical protein